MLELGDTSARLHAELGAYARQAGIDRLITVGEEASSAAEILASMHHILLTSRRSADFPHCRQITSFGSKVPAPLD